MSAIDTLLSRLDGVKRTGPDRWLARCPAHDDRHASLSIRVLGDGTVLIHDFAGCAPHEVVAALGLTLDALYPTCDGQHSRPGERRPFAAADVLRAVEHESMVVAFAAASLAEGTPLLEADRERLWVAHARISAAVVESGHG